MDIQLYALLVTIALFVALIYLLRFYNLLKLSQSMTPSQYRAMYGYNPKNLQATPGPNQSYAYAVVMTKIGCDWVKCCGTTQDADLATPLLEDIMEDARQQMPAAYYNSLNFNLIIVPLSQSRT